GREVSFPVLRPCWSTIAGRCHFTPTPASGASSARRPASTRAPVWRDGGFRLPMAFPATTSIGQHAMEVAGRRDGGGDVGAGVGWPRQRPNSLATSMAVGGRPLRQLAMTQAQAPHHLVASREAACHTAPSEVYGTIVCVRGTTETGLCSIFT